MIAERLEEAATDSATASSLDAENPESQLPLAAAGLSSPMPDHELAALIEALLLVAPEPPTVEELAAGAELAT